MQKSIATVFSIINQDSSAARTAESTAFLRKSRIMAMSIRVAFFVLAAFLIAPSAMAQSPSHEESRFEVFGGYSYIRDNGENLHGWTGALIVNVNDWLGLAADFDGHYDSFGSGAGKVRFSAYGYTFGPHVSFHNKTRVKPFVFALFGGVHERIKVGSVTGTDNGFAMNLGGGLDVRLNEHVSLRLIQADAAYTRFSGAGDTSPRISTGLVLHFGKR